MTVIAGVSLAFAPGALPLPISSALQAGLPVVLYFGPETLWPVTSFLAAAIGILLTFWRYVVDAAKRIFTGARGTPDAGRPALDPGDVDISITTTGAQRGRADEAAVAREDEHR